MESRHARAPFEPLVALRVGVKIHRDGAVRALDGVSLEIPAGQPLSIVGPTAQAHATATPIWAPDLGPRFGPPPGGIDQAPAAGGTAASLIACRRSLSWLVCMHCGCVPLRE